MLLNKIRSFFFGKVVGRDSYGNTYYELKKINSFGKKKRWVIYSGKPDPTFIPAGWHLWLHYSVDELPSKTRSVHVPNLSGTSDMYLPARLTSDFRGLMFYQAWSPKK